MNFGGDRIDTALNSSTTSSLTGVAWTFGGGYTVLQDPQHRLDVLGVRYFGLKASSDWQLSAVLSGPNGQVFAQSGSISQREDLWDVIVGVRGRLKLGGGSWFVPYYLDAGTGSSALTARGLVGIGYAFKWGNCSPAIASSTTISRKTDCCRMCALPARHSARAFVSRRDKRWSASGGRSLQLWLWEV